MVLQRTTAIPKRAPCREPSAFTLSGSSFSDHSPHGSLLMAQAHAPSGSGTLVAPNSVFWTRRREYSYTHFNPTSNKSKNNRYPQTRVNWPKQAIFSPKRLKTRLQGQSSVSIAPWLGRVTLRETLRYPTPFPFGVTTEAASSTLPATRSSFFSLLSLVKDESCVASQGTTADQYKVLTPSTRTRQRVLAICSLYSLLTRNFDR